MKNILPWYIIHGVDVIECYIFHQDSASSLICSCPLYQVTENVCDNFLKTHKLQLC